MVCLDSNGGANKGYGFDHVRVKGSLSEKINRAELLGFLFEYLDERMAYASSLLLRIFHALQSRKKLLTGIDVAKALPESLGE